MLMFKIPGVLRTAAYSGGNAHYSLNVDTSEALEPIPPEMCGSTMPLDRACSMISLETGDGSFCCHVGGCRHHT